MGKLVYIMGKSGTGKSRSMKNLPADRFGLINPEGKDLPFGKDAPAFKVERVVVDSADDIVDAIKRYAKKFKIVVVDDFQTVMTNEFMRRSSEIGYQKWTDIGKHAWEIAEAAKDVPDDVIVYVLCHTEENENGGEKIKTLGKLLDQNVVLESKSTIVLKTGVIDGKYYFFTQNNGKDTAKSPEGMFPSYAINNDLQYVDDKIRNYYDLPGAKSDAEMVKADAEAAQDVEKPSSGRKSRKKDERTREEVQQSNKEKMQKYMEDRDKAVEKAADGREEIPFEEAAAAADSVPVPDMEKIPRRTRAQRTATDDTLKEDTYFYIAHDDNFVLKHAGDVAPEGGKVISKEEFQEGVKRISQEGQPEAPAAEAMNPPEETAGRRRRTRK